MFPQRKGKKICLHCIQTCPRGNNFAKNFPYFSSWQIRVVGITLGKFNTLEISNLWIFHRIWLTRSRRKLNSMLNIYKFMWFQELNAAPTGTLLDGTPVNKKLYCIIIHTYDFKKLNGDILIWYCDNVIFFTNLNVN